MNVVIYFKNGGTAHFSYVEDYGADSKNVFFTHLGEWPKERKRAIFYKDSIAGIARTEELEK